VLRPAAALALPALVLALLPAVPTTAGAAEPDYGEVLDILPPGQSGTVTAADAAKVVATDPQHRVAVDGQNAPPHFADQLEMYDALNTVDPAALRESDLSRFYKPATFDVPAGQVLRTEDPRPGVHITWDDYGVPHVKGATHDDVAFGAGYAGTKDRMFLQDVLRHAGAARSAEFLGPTDANVAMDQEQLRAAFYTRDEAAAQVAALPGRFGAEGTRMVAAVDAFVAGINAAQEALCPANLPVGTGCPAEYAVLGKQPQPWDRADVVYVASLVGGIFGKGGGGELANARWLRQLQHKLGPRAGRKVYSDLRERNDSEAPTTATTTFRYGGRPGIHPGRSGVALPDLHGETAPGTGADAGSSLPVALPSAQAVQGRTEGLRLDLPFGDLDLSSVGPGLSNALLVGADRTTTGHPLTVFGPQTGYYAPQLLTEQAVVAPGIRARGVSFAATNLVVELGRGVDYAWSATSAGSDNVDTVVERLCDPAGGTASVDSEGYLDGDRCVPMDRYVHEETALPNAAAPGAPQSYRFLVLRTAHGIVQLRTTVGGEPVAVVLQRSTYGRELDSVVGFERLGNPEHVTDAASFATAASAIDYTFNWFYADDRDIAYFSSGLLPRRADGVDPSLPRWGDAAYDWQGWLSADEHPQQVNPPSGYLVSWNNKPAPQWAAADDQWGYGPVHRSLAISDRVADEVDQGGVTTASLVAAVQGAATVDSRAFYTLPYLLDVIGDDPALADATALRRGGLDRGAHRIDADRDGSYEDQAAIALFDTWWESGGDGVAKDLLRGTLGDLVDQLPQRLDDHPRQGLGSSWNGVAWYGYVVEELAGLTGRDAPAGWSRNYCGGGSLDRCRSDLQASLGRAVDGVLAAQGVSSVDQLTYDKHTDDIRHVAAGVVGVRPIDWQNRPTFQQVVEFSGHRGR
jgi:acyl-homoserine lactone acylase PvdQ